MHKPRPSTSPTAPWPDWQHVRSVSVGDEVFWQRHPDRSLPRSVYAGLFKEAMRRHGGHSLN